MGCEYGPETYANWFSGPLFKLCNAHSECKIYAGADETLTSPNTPPLLLQVKIDLGQQ